MVIYLAHTAHFRINGIHYLTFCTFLVMPLTACIFVGVTCSFLLHMHRINMNQSNLLRTFYHYIRNLQVVTTEVVDMLRKR
jgi:hypothetical protein